MNFDDNFLFWRRQHLSDEVLDAESHIGSCQTSMIEHFGENN